MDEVYLDKNGNLFINGQKITHVLSVKSETTFADTIMTIKFNANYKSDYLKTIKEANSLADESTSNIIPEIKIDNKVIIPHLQENHD